MNSGCRPLVLALLVLGTLAACTVPMRSAPSAAASRWRWQRQEAGLPRQVLVPAIAADPADGTLYAGLYQAASLAARPPGSRAWQAVETPFAGAPVFQLRFTGSGELLAATGAGLFARQGDAWQALGPLPEASPAVFAVAATPTTLFAATDGQGLQRRTAAGEWTSILPHTILSLALGLPPDSAPAGPPIVYAGSAGDGLFTSPDGGQTWLPPALPGTFVPEVAARPGRPRTAIASLRTQLARTDDGGQSWRRLRLDWTAEEVVSLLWTPDNRLYAGTGRGNLYRSLDDGATWTRLAERVPAEGGLLALAEHEGQLLAGAWVGVYGSPDGGGTWADLGPELGEVQAAAFLPTDRGLLLGTRAGLFRWEPAAGAWQPLAGEFPGGVSALAHSAGGWLLAGTAGGVVRSSDGGRTWQPAPDPHVSVRQLLPVGACVYAVASFERVYRSCDDGGSWQARWAGLGLLTEVKTVAALAPEAVPSSPLLLAGTDHGLFRSRRGGEDWRQSSLALSDQTVLALLPLAGSELLAGGTRGLWRSPDGGQTFQATGLAELTVTSLLPPAGPDGPALIVAGTAFEGLYLSADGGRTWHPGGPAELRQTVVRALAWLDGDLFVATPGGVWRGAPDGTDGG